MVIQPNSAVKVYSGIPLDNSYRNTLYFGTPTTQNEYFHNGNPKLRHTLSNLTYQRVNSGVIRVGIDAGKLYDCNYVAFQNNPLNSKWFYGFITEVEYVNTEVTDIHYEIDVMQTYIFDITLKECLVLREHSETDNIGDNLIDEGLQLGGYVLNNYYQMEDLSTYSAIGVQYIADNGNGNILDNVYTGSTTKVFPMTEEGMNALTNLLDEYSAKADNVLSVYMIPSSTFDYNIPATGGTVTFNQTAMSHIYNYSLPTNVDGYTPRNNKLFTFPYSYLGVYDGCGNELQLKYEYFTNENGIKDNYCRLETFGTLAPPVKRTVAPLYYKGSQSNNVDVGIDGVNMNEALTLAGFPTCGWKNDAYFSILGMYQISEAISDMSVNGASLPNTNDVFNGIDNFVSWVGKGLKWADDNIRHAYNSVIGYKVKGSSNNSSTAFSKKLLHFYKANVSINSQYAKTIDDFFTAYGYATSELKIPNTHVRERWTYTRTQGCNIVGNVPSKDIKKMCNIFDDGITFWVNASEIGNYSLSNNPLY